MSKFYSARHEPVFMYAAIKKEFLIAILEPILDKKIEDLQILNPNLIQDYYKLRGQRLDLLVKTKDEIINVELNTNYSEEIKIRNLHYIFKLASENTERGNKYKIGYPIIQVNLNFYNSKYEKNIYTLYDKINKIELTDYIKIYNVGIDKYIKNYYNNDKKFTKGEEALIMLDLSKQGLEELSEKSEIVNNFKEEVIKANNDEFVVDWISREEEQKQYEEVMYEKGLNQGKQQGLQEGISQGKQQGLSEGIIQGKQEGISQAKIDVAKEMLELNMDLETISRVTKLAKNQIESLRN